MVARTARIGVTRSGGEDNSISSSDPTAWTPPVPFIDIDDVLGRKWFTTTRRNKLRYYRRLLFFKFLYLASKVRHGLFETPRKLLSRIL